MLQRLREKAQGAVTWIIVLLIVGAFALWGLTDYFAAGGQEAFAAKVDGEKISWRMVDTLFDRISQQYQGGIDQKILKEQVRTLLVRRAALISQIKKLGFQAGDEQVASLLLQIPAFQVGGKFSKDQYLKALANEGLTDSIFRKQITQDILLGQLEQGLVYSSFTLPTELVTIVALLDQKRDFGFALISEKNVQDTIQITPEEIKTYYEAHKASFIRPEQVILESVTLSLDQLMKRVQVSKADDLAYYNEHVGSYTLPERVHVRHILLTAPQNDASLDKQAKSKIEDLQTELKKGADFAALAKKSSQDPGSAEKGGDLGFFMKGQMVPEFEKVAFELKKPGEISAPVRTQFGYHLIQLVEHKPIETRPFEAVQALVEEQLKREKAQQLFIEKGEMLARLAFEQPKTLAPIAERMSLKIEETEPFGRESQKDSKGIAGNPAVVKVVFSDPVLTQGNNSEPIKFSDTEIVVVRVKKHMPSEQQTLEQVEKGVRAILVLTKAKGKIKELGETLLARMKAGNDPAQVAKEAKLDWVTKSNVVRLAPPEMDRNILNVAFQVSPPNVQSGKPSIQGFILPTEDYVIVAVTKVIPGDVATLAPDVKAAYLQSLTEAASQVEYAIFVTQAIHNAKIELSKKEPK